MKKAKPRIALIDYDMGNLRSVSRALENSGCSVEWVDKPPLKHFDGVVLPGVGAFSVAVQNLKKRNLFQPIFAWIAEGKPFFGICLGYQLLFEKSEEGEPKAAQGLSVFKGKVRKLKVKKNLKVPHMGWNQVWMKAERRCLPFKEIKDGSYFYFVHSYIPVPDDKKIIATTTPYGFDFASSIVSGNLYASQFHPEKSGENGLRLLANFIERIQN